MICTATASTVQTLIEMGAAMAAEAPHFAGREYDRAKARQAVEYCVEQGSAFVDRDPVTGRVRGMALADLVEHWVMDEVYACDLAVYVQPDCRGSTTAVRLIKAMEVWARGAGAVRLVMGVSTGLLVGRTAGLYRRMGYQDETVALAKRL